MQIDLAELVEWCMQFSPLVGTEWSSDPPSLLLDVSGLTDRFGGEAALVETLRGQLEQRGLAARATVADTIGAAWAVAHFGDEPLVPPGGTLAALRPLPVEALRLPEAVLDLLHQLGIRRIEQLEAIPRAEFLSRFGPELLRRWDQATGRMDEPLPAYEPSPRFEARWSPEYPTTRRETIEAAVEQLVVQVAAALVQDGLGAMRLDCRLECGGRQVEAAVGLFQATAWAKHLFQLLQVQLERLRLPGPVEAIYVAATSTAPLDRRQQELFPDGPRRQPRQLAGLIDRLSNRLGRQAVVRVRLRHEAQPELAWQAQPLISPRHRSPAKPAPTDLPPRPLRLLPRPMALESRVGQGREEAGGTSQTGQLPMQALCVATEQAATAAPPIIHAGGTRRTRPTLHLFGRPHHIARTWGPERIETGWWRGRAVGRDYYCVETTAGRRFWIFRRLRDGQWFLHGTFD